MSNRDHSVELDWQQFFQDLSAVTSDLERCQRTTVGVDTLENFAAKIDFAIETLTWLLNSVNHASTEFQDVEQLCHNFLIFKQNINCRLLNTTNSEPALSQSEQNCEENEERRRGRPKLLLKEQTLTHLRDIGYSWCDIAALMLVSRMTIYRRVRELGIADVTGYSRIDDNQLDEILRSFKRTHGLNAGRSLAMGYLKSAGLRIQQKRVAKALVRIDPDSSRLRWASVISRRTYSVPGPNSLWHIDGHHSLIRWGFVIHGGIDGYSRLIVFLRCSDNNRKETVLEIFDRALQDWGVPSRVRTDKGGENVLVWTRMEEVRGSDRQSFLAASSVHNQRIERLWRDVWNSVSCEFYYTFQAMEEQGILDICDAMHMYVLHYIFLPRINHVVSNFVSTWNNHPLRTERNLSPHRIWFAGMMDQRNAGTFEVVDQERSECFQQNYRWYGMDWSAPSPLDNGLSTVDVDPVESPLTDAQEETLRQLDPLQMSASFGIDVFMSAMNALQCV